MFASGPLYAHHCVGIGIAEMTAVLGLAGQWGRGEETKGGRRLWPAGLGPGSGGLSALEYRLDSGVGEPNERFVNSAMIQLPMLRRLPPVSHLSSVSFSLIQSLDQLQEIGLLIPF